MCKKVIFKPRTNTVTQHRSISVIKTMFHRCAHDLAFEFVCVENSLGNIILNRGAHIHTCISCQGFEAHHALALCTHMAVLDYTTFGTGDAFSQEGLVLPLLRMLLQVAADAPKVGMAPFVGRLAQGTQSRSVFFFAMQKSS